VARIAGSSGARTAAAIRRAALRLIWRQGYAAMNLRALAAAVGIRPSSLYNHIETKQALLFDLIAAHLTSLLDATEAALERAGPDTLDRLRAFAAHHVLYHLEKPAEVHVANAELRALDPPNRARAIALRRRYEALLIDLLERGAAEGRLAIADSHVAAYAILAMLTGVCVWYKPGGRLSKAAVVDQHVALMLAGARGPILTGGSACQLNRPTNYPSCTDAS
jgi:AcrR family transcriptional regulator